MGVEAVVAPLMRIDFIDGSPLDLSDVQALLMTSANGVRAFAARNIDRDLPVMAVGDATAREAREAGFGEVHSSAGDVGDLAADVRDRLDPDAGALLHPAGSKVAGDLAGMLSEVGFRYRREVMYRAETAAQLPPSAADALRGGSIDGVMIYSPRTGKTFASLVEVAGLTEKLPSVHAYCLSQNVVDTIAHLPWAAVLVAQRPEQKALLALLDET